MQVQILEQTIFNFLILGKSRFPPKKFYNINYRPILLRLRMPESGDLQQVLGNKKKRRAVLVAQLIELSFPILEVRSLNLVIGKNLFILNICFLSIVY